MDAGPRERRIERVLAVLTLTQLERLAREIERREFGRIEIVIKHRRPKFLEVTDSIDLDVCDDGSG